MSKKLNKRLANLPGVQAAVHSAAESLLADVSAEFESHDRPGGHQVGMEKHGIDRFVYLEGPAPLALEFGHFTREPANPSPDWTPTWVPGLHLFDKAVDRARSRR